MRPATFVLHRPATLADALAALAAGAQPLAGGQSLLPAMRLRDAEPGALIDLTGVDALDADIRVTGAHVRIGARVTHATLAGDASIRADLPWLADAAAQIGDVQVRNLGTVLGNVCWADPRANMAVALLASDATVIAADADETCSAIPLDEFFTGFRRHALDRRLAIALTLPRASGARGCYLEFSRQRQDLALVNVCTVAGANGLRVAVGGIDATPVRLRAVECNGADALAAALDPARHRPITDQHGDAAYKLHLAGVLVRRALAAIGVEV